LTTALALPHNNFRNAEVSFLDCGVPGFVAGDVKSKHSAPSASLSCMGLHGAYVHHNHVCQRKACLKECLESFHLCQLLGNVKNHNETKVQIEEKIKHDLGFVQQKGNFVKWKPKKSRVPNNAGLLTTNPRLWKGQS
jgi:hypothetical protein